MRFTHRNDDGHVGGITGKEFGTVMSSKELQPHLMLAQAEFFFDQLPANPFRPGVKFNSFRRRYFFERLKFQMRLKKEFEFSIRVSELNGDGTIASEGGDTMITLRQKEHSKTALPGYRNGIVRFPMFHCEFNVNPNVYIPRVKIAIVNLHIMKELSRLDLSGKTFWDLGCGSGITGIMVKKQFPRLHVVCTDISNQALEITRENAKANLVDIEILQGNLLEDFQERQVDFLSFFSPATPKNSWKDKVSYSEYYIPAVTEPIVAFDGGNLGTDLLEKVCLQARDRIKSVGKIFLIGGRVPPISIKLLGDKYETKAATDRLVEKIFWTFTLR